MTKVAVVGSRQYPRLELVREFIGTLPTNTTVISGGAEGVDAVAERTARARGLPVQVFPADWDKRGRGAGLERNSLIVGAADSIVCFWDQTSTGTLDVIEKAKKSGKPLTVRGPEPVEHEFSATQLEDAGRCQRLWWFGHVVGMKSEQTAAMVFGERIHAVVERWLKADAQGRGPDGKPVELYPLGWDDGLTPAEGDLVKRLVAVAIEGSGEKAVLTRHPENLVEIWFDSVPLVENATLKGRIDIVAPDGIHDHKSTKNIERYALTPSSLRGSTQMQLYGKVFVEDRRLDGKPIPERVRFRHNYFSKDPQNPVVRTVDAWVTPREIDEAWGKLQTRARELLSIKRNAKWNSDVELDEIWRKIPGAATPGSPLIRSSDWNHPCRKYGGCPYASVCGESQKPSEFLAEVVRTRENKSVPDNGKQNDQKPAVSESLVSIETTQGGATNVSIPNIFAARMAAAQAANGNGTATAPPPVTTTPTIPPPGNSSTPVQPAPTQQAVAAPPTQTRAPVPGAPLWGRPHCGACEGKGFNSRGNVCRPCAGNAASEKRPLPEWYETGFDNGLAWWEAKTEFAGQIEALTNGSREGSGGSIRIAPAGTAQVQAKVETPVPTTPQAAPAASTPAPAPTTPPAAPTQPAASQAPSQGEASKPKTRKGFTLYVDCAPLGESAISLNDVFHRYAQTLAAEAKKAGQRDKHGNEVATYWQLEPFPRRDSLAACAEFIVETEKFGTKAVVITTDTPDHRAFAAAFKPLAYLVVEPVGVRG